MTTPETVSLKTRIDALTGLRFFAALAVYLHHHPKPTFLPHFISTLMAAGYNGVTIFFVLSGFVIGLNYFDMLAKPSARGVFKFAVARFARIYPLYALVLLYIWLNMEIPSDTADIIFHFLAVQAWSADLGWAFAYNPPGWSIGVEFFFYACFPLLALILAPLRHRPKWLWTLVFVVIIVSLALTLYFQFSGRGALAWERPGSAHRWLYRTPLFRLGDFVLGVLGALIYESMLTVRGYAKRLWSAVPYIAVSAILGLMMWTPHLYSAFSWDVSYAPLAFCLVLGLALSPSTWLNRLMASRPLVILGEASFALYLIHYHLMGAFEITQYASFEPWVAMCLWFAFAGICILLSMSLNAYIETPFRKLINRLSARVLDKPKSTPS